MDIRKAILAILAVCVSVVALGQGRGIDVSRYQKSIEWSKVKGAGIKFVYIKATEGATYTDPYFERNFAGAKRVGLPVGVYHFFRMTSSASAQFAHFKRTVAGRAMDLLPMIDIEVSDGYSKAAIQRRLDEIIALFKSEYGCTPMIYSSQVFYNRYLAPKYNRYHLYLGRYGGKRPVIDGKGMYTIWQYTRHGRIAGISTAVDICRFNPKYSVDDIKIRKDGK